MNTNKINDDDESMKRLLPPEQIDTDRHLYPAEEIPLQEEFNTIPEGGWSNHTKVSGGLEWLYAGPAAPTPDYFEVFPSHFKIFYFFGFF